MRRTRTADKSDDSRAADAKAMDNPGSVAVGEADPLRSGEAGDGCGGCKAWGVEEAVVSGACARSGAVMETKVNWRVVPIAAKLFKAANAASSERRRNARITWPPTAAIAALPFLWFLPK